METFLCFFLSKKNICSENQCKSKTLFQKSPKFYNGNPHSKLMVSLGSGSRFWRFSMVFHEFSLKKMVFKVLPTHIDAEFHGESISEGFRAIRARKVGQKLKKPKKSRQTRFSGHPPPKSLSNYPASDCRYRSHSST